MKPISNDIDFLKFLGMQETQYIEPVETFREGLVDRAKNGFILTGERLPWEKAESKIRLRLGEVSIWAGINGHGKSLILGQVLAWLPRDVKCLIASLEMKPVATLERMCRQTLGGGFPTEKYINEFIEQTDNIHIYDQTDSVEPDRILGMCHYAAQELGIKHIMIDSLMKCGISPEDYPKQKEFVDRLCWAAKSENIHIHLVHHVRKTSGGESSRPDKFDIKGAGEITDLVDNAFIVHRNKKKEQERDKAHRENTPFDESDSPDATLTVAKQRHGEWEGAFGLWFNRESTQFVSGDRRSLRWRG